MTKDKFIGFRASPDLRKWLEEKAKSTSGGISGVVRDCCEKVRVGARK